MAAKRTRTNRAQPLGMINEPKILFNLRVTEIMPVTELRRIHLLQKLRQFALGWNLFIGPAALDSQTDTFRTGILDHTAQAVLHVLQILGGISFSLLHGFYFQFHVIARKI